MKQKRRTFGPAVLAAIIKRQNGKCACCGEPLGDDPRGMHFDHEMPLWLGGADTVDNLRALLVRHHIVKTSREAGQRAKIERIKDKDGLHRRKMNARDMAIQKIIERTTA